MMAAEDLLTSEEWAEKPFIEYLDAVDELLLAKRGDDSDQHELDFIAECQEQLVSPEECVQELLSGNTT